MQDQQEFRDFCKVLQNLTIQTYPNNQLKHVLELKPNQHPLDYVKTPAVKPCIVYIIDLPDSVGSKGLAA